MFCFLDQSEIDQVMKWGGYCYMSRRETESDWKGTARGACELYTGQTNCGWIRGIIGVRTTGYAMKVAQED